MGSADPEAFREALLRGLRPGADLRATLGDYADLELKTGAEAGVLCEALRFYRDHPRADDEAFIRSPLHTLAGFFQQIAGEDAYARLKADGIPVLLELYDARLAALERKPDDPLCGSELMFVLKILAYYPCEETLGRIVAAARDPFNRGYMWSVVFSAFEEDHPLAGELIDRLRRRLPDGFVGVAFLDLCNQRAGAGLLDRHPFNGEEGVKRLEACLRDSDPGAFSRAHSATAALPFVDKPQRDGLLALALDHIDPGVQLEAAWASAKVGSENGLKKLIQSASLPHCSARAVRYLEELGRADAIPGQARDPDFKALAEMSEWLQHPNEFGRAPDELALYDTREIFWPPTGDRRRVWLFKYAYRAKEPGGADERGMGMVGSITFALFGETTDSLSPEDVYGMHCAWELQQTGDPAAPKDRGADSGRAILRKHNPGAGF
ncbi:MAG: hypothetical protein M5U26_13695 [Planctomycetota bacterium]|nr:hypothetical protein [Planctomycetota bacterium]